MATGSSIATAWSAGIGTVSAGAAVRTGSSGDDRARGRQGRSAAVSGGALLNRWLAVVPHVQEVSQPDISWMKKHVSILAIARALGLTIRRGKAKCWRTENHRHG